MDKICRCFVKVPLLDIEGLNKTSLLKLLFQLSAILYFIQSKIIGARYLSVKKFKYSFSFIFLVFYFYKELPLIFCGNFVTKPATREWPCLVSSNLNGRIFRKRNGQDLVERIWLLRRVWRRATSESSSRRSWTRCCRYRTPLWISRSSRLCKFFEKRFFKKVFDTTYVDYECYTESTSL